MIEHQNDKQRRFFWSFMGIRVQPCMTRIRSMDFGDEAADVEEKALSLSTQQFLRTFESCPFLGVDVGTVASAFGGSCQRARGRRAEDGIGRATYW